MSRASYFSTLFDEQEYVCFAYRIKDTAVLPLSRFSEQESNYVSLNPMRGDMDLSPESSSLPYARTDLPRRADCNIHRHRNILVEMDDHGNHGDVPLHEQYPIVRNCRMPYTTSVYSGNSSIHFVISLVEPVSRERYDDLTWFIQTAFPAKLDPSAFNPSRLTRTPGPLHQTTGKEQRLMEIKQRVTAQDVMDWAASMGVIERPKEVQRVFLPSNPATDLKRVMEAVSTVTRDIAPEYDQWLRLGVSLTNLGEEGRTPFHTLSSLSSKYSRKDTDDTFTQLLRQGPKKTSLGTFFYMIKNK